ncbi:MAG: MBOAT family protein [Clostridia bacterium]|nr:MBOAT family protein [Clostridia bacterium]MBQ1934737.1 MBOAT family protein [Clostridia bacterium]
MLFSSITFLYVFLAATLILYAIAPKIYLKNIVLLAFSLVFYSWGEPKLVVLMVVSVACGYVFGLLMEKYRENAKLLRAFMIISVIISASFLVYFKYTNFFIDNINLIPGVDIPFKEIALPVGISFYTFQIISYTVDVYRGTPAQRNPLDLACYIAMFPQLIAGPIVRYVDVAAQLKSRKHTFEKIAYGIRRFAVGFAKKVLVADSFGELVAMYQQSSDKSVLFVWMYAFAFMLQLYFDFSGYSDMAIGLGKIFGFDFVENFNYPYISRSISEFWRRWHMSLGSWFRDYLYIPLGGNRVSAGRHIFNMLVVWMFTGFWHGAAWTFVVWGLYFAVMLTLEKFFIAKWLKKSKLLGHVYTLFFILISFVLFNGADMKGAIADIGSLFGAGGLPLVSKEAVYYLRNYAVLFIGGIIGATPIVASTARRLFATDGENAEGKGSVQIAISAVVETLFIAAMLILVTAWLVDGSFSSFLYFRF